MRFRFYFMSLALAAVFAAGPAFCAVPYGKFVTTGPKSKPYFALTFDDGPGESTPDVLAALSAYNAKATFFMLGYAVKKKPQEVRKVYEAGHLIGNHTYAHANFNKVPEKSRDDRLEKEIKDTSALIEAEIGRPTHYMRMPYGITKSWVLAVAKRTKHVVINWDYGSDWESRPKEELLKEYLSNLKPGSVMLLHDGGNRRDTTVWITTRILEEAQKRRLNPVRLDVLLGYTDDSPAAAAVPLKPESGAETAKPVAQKPQPKASVKPVAAHTAAKPAAPAKPVVKPVEKPRPVAKPEIHAKPAAKKRPESKPALPKKTVSKPKAEIPAAKAPVSTNSAAPAKSVSTETVKAKPQVSVSTTAACGPRALAVHKASEEKKSAPAKILEENKPAKPAPPAKLEKPAASHGSPVPCAYDTCVSTPPYMQLSAPIPRFPNERTLGGTHKPI
ncbi:MAG: polysaccharide deacetylase family protein [Elusimicrobiales bacterium]|nr:polysaccharide deacetylase family protein [Elusimicrobiales bacterium]